MYESRNISLASSEDYSSWLRAPGHVTSTKLNIGNIVASGSKTFESQAQPSTVARTRSVRESSSLNTTDSLRSISDPQISPASTARPIVTTSLASVQFSNWTVNSTLPIQSCLAQWSSYWLVSNSVSFAKDCVTNEFATVLSDYSNAESLYGIWPSLTTSYFESSVALSTKKFTDTLVANGFSFETVTTAWIMSDFEAEMSKVEK